MFFLSFYFVAFRFNRLTGVVRSSLQNIQKAIKVKYVHPITLKSPSDKKNRAIVLEESILICD